MKTIDRRMVVGALATGIAGFGVSPALPATRDAKPAQGGIGGTGIVGTLTDFGSVLVNGLKVETDGRTQVTSAFGSARLDSLEVGHSLTIEAATQSGTLFARRVHITHPLIGVVEGSPGISRRIRVAGIRVVVEQGAIVEMERGARVAVSGVWRGNRVVASRIDRLPSAGASVIAGALDVGRNPSDPAIAGQRLIVSRGINVPAAGSFVTVIGEARDNGFAVAQLIPGRFTGAAGALQRLSVEGFLDPTNNAPFYEIAGLGHSFDPQAKLGRFRSDRSLFSGAYIGTFEVETAIKLPKRLDRRRDLLRDILRDGAAPRAESTR